MFRADHLFLSKLEGSLDDTLRLLDLPEEIAFWYRYSLSGGKKVRPLCMSWVFERLTGQSAASNENCFKASWALEMIHAYSLIHDDLPAMDDDDFRRGRATVHRLTGEAEAILVGDALLTSAFELISHTQPLVELVRELAFAAGARGMVYGQWKDMREDFSSLETVETIHRLKTGALFGASASMAGLLARRYRSLSVDELNRLREWGVELGVLFQWVDDLLDDEIPTFFKSRDELRAHCERKVAQLKDLQSGLWSSEETEQLFHDFLERKI
ncbi:hypothetical protein GW915_08795 [bacterium]|nr:hypothetical protein [bacterium]